MMGGVTGGSVGWEASQEARSGGRRHRRRAGTGGHRAGFSLVLVGVQAIWGHGRKESGAAADS